jgi:hypothetical protein
MMYIKYIFMRHLKIPSFANLLLQTAAHTGGDSIET